MMKRYLLLSCAAFLGLACSRSPDRLVDGSGQVVAGRLESIQGGKAVFDGFSVDLPDGPASVLLRSGALYRGTVSLENGILEVSGAGIDASAARSDVAAVTWGPSSIASSLLDIHAASGWTDTHVRIEPGSRVMILSGGCSTMGTGVTGPSGLERTATTVSLSPESPDGSLIGRIGADGRLFTIGECWSGIPTEDGNLFLAVNVPSTGGAAGFYTVSVTVESDSGEGLTAIFPARK